jgi:hypothetical protein
MRTLLQFSFVFLIATAVSFWDDGAFAAATTSSPVLNEFDCLRNEEIADLSQDFRIEIDPAIQGQDFQNCDSKNIKNKIFRALKFLKYGQFTNPQKSADGAFTAVFANESPFEFFKKRVSTIHLTTDCKIPWSIAYALKGKDVIHICGNKIADNPAILLAAAMIHESRHTDLDDTNEFAHVKCTHGIYRGFDMACDKDLAQHGAYFYELEYFMQVARFGKNFSQEIRANARLLALTIIANNLNSAPILETESHTILQASTGEILLLNKDLSITNSGFKFDTTVFDYDQGRLAVFNNQERTIGVLDFYVGFNPLLHDLAAYSNHTPRVDRTPLTALFYRNPENTYDGFLATINGGLFYAQSSSETGHSNCHTELRYSKVQFLTPEVCHGSEDRLYLKIDGKFFSLTQEQVKQQDCEPQPVSSCDPNFQSIISFEGHTLGLTNDGRLMMKQNSQWSEIPSTRGLQVKFLGRPFSLYGLFKR